MRVSVSVERLRWWLLAGAGLLVAVIAAFLGYAHFRAHRFLTDLPGKLGIDIRQETNHWTFSQTVQGRTVYTVHAAKAVQHKDGKYSLHDVGIVVYGKKQDRADRIYGSEFEYDPAAEVIRAAGEVFIDLQAPEAGDAKGKMDYAVGKDLGGGQGGESDAGGGDTGKNKDQRLIHIKTSGLVYLQKLGVAATDNDIEFQSGGLTGHAVGADYNSDSGVVVLHAAVKVNGLQNDRPVVLTASHAVLDRQGQTAMLTQAKYVSVGAGAGGGETAQAQHVVMHLRKDGTVERVEGEGDVVLTGGDSGRATAPRGEMMLSLANRPVSAVLSGGVRYGEDGVLRQAQGESAEGRVGFDATGRVSQVVMNGAVRLHERVKASNVTGVAWSERELEAGATELAIGSDSAGKTLLKDAKATGSARLTVVSPAEKDGVSGTASSALAGDVLTAHFVRVNGADHLAEVHGNGNATLRRMNATGVVNTSRGDSLVAKFRPVTAAGVGQDKVLGNGATRQGSDEIASAVEQGHVVMTQIPVKKAENSAAAQEERATAERAVYDGELEKMTLTGDVQVSDGTSVLWADRVVTEQATGDAAADGSVKVSYKQAGSSDEEVHVLAGRAELKHDSQVAMFYGAAGKAARLWQGASQVEAPVLQFEQRQRRLVARGDGLGAAMAVHTVLVSGGEAAKNGGGEAVVTNANTDAAKSGSMRAAKGDVGKGGGATAKAGKTNLIRVASRELVYSDEARRADFTGGVKVDGSDGTMKAQQAVVYLQGAPGSGADRVTPPNGSGAAMADGGGKTMETKKSAPQAESGGFMGGSVERFLATGRIEIEQPGRRATGEQVVYTASDGMFVLTGTAAALPKVVDQQRGTVTGTQLRFHAGDESVVVSNGDDGKAGQRVRTETRVKNKE